MNSVSNVHYVGLLLLITILIYAFVQQNEFIQVLINTLLGGFLALTVTNRQQTTINQPDINKVEVNESDKV